MPRTVKLVGLDFGTTTSSVVVAEGELLANSVTGRTELSQVRESFRSEIVFTPLVDERLDVERLERYLDDWLTAGNVTAEELFSGGALLTGLAARRQNAAGLIDLVRRRLGDALVASADDPCLESWLAFMGSCASLSQAHPDRPIINLDIGGGTTNVALGQAGDVLKTGCLFVGARHVQVTPGTYRIERLSEFATELLEHLEIRKGIGDELSRNDVDAVLDFYLRLLEATVTGQEDAFDAPVVRRHIQVPFISSGGTATVTLSGGVGQLVYEHLAGKAWPSTTCFGDFGIDLAQRIVESPMWANDLRRFVPTGLGRATVYGLLRHTTQISGSTLHLPHPEALPWRDLPIVGRIAISSTDEAIRDTMMLARRSASGGSVEVILNEPTSVAVREIGTRIAKSLQAIDFPHDKPLALFVTGNVGKTLGQYVTSWGATDRNLIVIDEVDVRDAQFAQIGKHQNQILPVSFYGLNASQHS